MDVGTIANVATATVVNSTFSGNSASDRGGAIENEGGTLAVTNSTFAGNSAAGATYGGGAIFIKGRTVTVTNSTFSGNSSGSIGGAISNFGGPQGSRRRTYVINVTR